MRSKVAQVRKRIKEKSNIDYSMSIPPRTQFLQNLCKTYTSEAVRGQSPETFTISVNPKDILVGGDSKHFRSCLNYKRGMYKDLIPKYLSNRYCAIAFVRNNRTGQFTSRVYLHQFLKDSYKEVLVTEEIYGENFPYNFMVTELFKKGVEVYHHDTLWQYGYGSSDANIVKLSNKEGYYV